MHTHRYTYMHAGPYVHAHTETHTHIVTYTCTFRGTGTDIHTHTHTRTRVHTRIYIYIYIYIYMHTHIHIQVRTYTYMVRRLAFPASPPQWYGLVGVGVGAWRVRRVVWSVGWGCFGRPGVTERAGFLRKPYASHKPYSVGRVPVFINFNLYHPSLNSA